MTEMPGMVILGFSNLKAVSDEMYAAFLTG